MKNPEIDPLQVSRAVKYPENFIELAQRALVQPSENYTPLQYLFQYVDGCSDYVCNLVARGTITMITGQKGCRKSTFVRTLLQTLLLGSPQSGNRYALTSKAQRAKVVLIDTEQDKRRVANTQVFLQRLCTAGGKMSTSEFYDRVKCYAVRGWTCADVAKLLDYVCAEHNPDLIVIDVISNLVDDINDQAAAKLAVDNLNNLCKEYNSVAFLGVIHQNPSPTATPNDKMAGALGTKLWQAAECVLHVQAAKKDTFEKQPDNDEITSLNGKGSIITFAEYRERRPTAETMLVRNENEKGQYDTSVAPCLVETKKERGKDPQTFVEIIKEQICRSKFEYLQAQEIERQNPKLL
jgi:hypothetical protein